MMKLKALLLLVGLAGCGDHFLQNSTASVRQDVNASPDPNSIGSAAIAPTDATNSNQVSIAASMAATRPSSELRGVPADAIDKSTDRSTLGAMSFQPSTSRVIVKYESTLWVPSKPNASGTVFIWPGLEPADNAKPFGVLQPVLVWGPVCTSADTMPPEDYSTWWIAGYYVTNVCYVGQAMAVSVGDPLRLSLELENNIWHQTVTNLSTHKTVTFNYDTKGQAQIWPMFNIEPYNQNPPEPVAVADIEITYAKPLSAIPKLQNIGTNDAMTDIKLSADRKTITVDSLILRAKGVN